MRIHFTEAAIAELNKKMTDSSDILKLVYDTDGCGCAVSGVVQLWLVRSLQDGDVQADAAPFRIVYEQRQEVFFEEELKLNYHPDTFAFRLSSRQQIYNHAMSLIDKRHA